MPCAAVQQLPHVRRGACDWTAGGEGGESALVPFCDCRWQCFLVKNKLHILWKVVNYLKKIKLSKLLKFYTKLL
jgi:hypothetical protein